MSPRAPSTVALLVTATVLLVIVHCAAMVSADMPTAPRVARGRYKVGYMFGKRASHEDRRMFNNQVLAQLLGKPEWAENLGRDIQRDEELAQRVARHLDRDGEDYVSLRDLM